MAKDPKKLLRSMMIVSIVIGLVALAVVHDRESVCRGNQRMESQPKAQDADKRLRLLRGPA